MKAKINGSSFCFVAVGKPSTFYWTVPVTVDKEKKSPVVDKDSLRGLAPDFNRGEAVFERNTFKIVEINVFGNELLNFGTRREVSAVEMLRFHL